jgi:hypothetical protein
VEVKLRTKDEKLCSIATCPNLVGDNKGGGDFGVITKPSREVRDAKWFINTNLLSRDGNSAFAVAVIIGY